MRDLHCGGIFVAVARDDLYPEAHRLDGDLAAEFSRAEQHELDGRGGEGGAEFHMNYRLK